MRDEMSMFTRGVVSTREEESQVALPQSKSHARYLGSFSFQGDHREQRTLHGIMILSHIISYIDFFNNSITYSKLDWQACKEQSYTVSQSIHRKQARLMQEKTEAYPRRLAITQYEKQEFAGLEELHLPLKAARSLPTQRSDWVFHFCCHRGVT